MKNRTYHVDGASRPSDDQIFVFGSNEAGVHGAGAAAYALQLGAEWGNGFGLQNGTYAIPTKDKEIQTKLLSDIVPYIEEFVRFTHENPDMRFFVTRIGCGLAGFQNSQIAPLFKNAINCSFAEQWKPFLE